MFLGRTALAIVLVGAGAGAACSQRSVAVNTTARTTLAAEPAMLECDRFRFPPEALGRTAVDESDPAVQRARADLPTQMPGFEVLTLRELTRHSGVVLLGVGMSRPGYVGWVQSYIAVKEDGSETVRASESGCEVRPVAPEGQHFGRWALAPSSRPVPPDATELDLIVNDSNCRDGDPAEARMTEPVVAYDDQYVRIGVLFRTTPHGPGTHPLNCLVEPSFAYRLTLREPIGSRTLLDSSFYPAVLPPEGFRD